MFSATKSVVCVLVGIAIGEGLISGADQKASDFSRVEELRRRR